ncbi:MAG: carboxypeptidase-like regulatory domain-containing protein [Verrucomicrobiota bacterium]
MKTILIKSVLLIAVSSVGLGHEIEIRVLDDSGNPISNANAIISFDYDDKTVSKGETNEEGHFFAVGEIRPSALVRLSKVGLYGSVIRSGLGPEDHKLDVIMRRIENPDSLIVREVEVAIPETDGQLGFDFAAGDWLPPFGSGKVADFEIDFAKQMNGLDYSGKQLEKVLEMSKRAASARSEEWTKSDFHRRVGRWDATLQITFPTEGSGVLKLKEGFVPYCELTMPHEAPEESYAERLVIESSTYDSSKICNTQTPLFMRTRVEKRDGEITHAHFSKLPDGIRVDARGSLKFLYYFNPRENDQNLEFDPDQNLAEDQNRRFAP